MMRGAAGATLGARAMVAGAVRTSFTAGRRADFVDADAALPGFLAGALRAEAREETALEVFLADFAAAGRAVLVDRPVLLVDCLLMASI
jgi:hypothetical protein